MRIGLLSEFVYPFHKGGAEKRFYELAIRLVDRGHEVHWFGSQHWEGPPRMEHEGISLHAAAPARNVYAESGRRAVGPALRVGGALSVALARSRVELDLLDLSLYPFFHVFGSRLARRRVPLVVTWHEFWGEHWYDYLGRPGYFGLKIERWAARVPRRIVAVSDLARAGLLSVGVPASRVVTIHNGVDLDDVDRAPVGNGGADLIFFGRLKNHKNVDVLLRAVAVARSRVPEITCIIAGDGPEYGHLVRLANDLQLQDHVRFVGAPETERELYGFVKASRVCVNPSTKEGGGSITLLEANACGLPVIAVRDPLGIDESLIDDGVNGWWVESCDEGLLAAAIVAGLSDVAALSAMREPCRASVRRFDWDAITSQYEEVYREAVAAR
jgi:glycosyltransferase involved in cell wall biosynthesis